MPRDGIKALHIALGVVVIVLSVDLVKKKWYISLKAWIIHCKLHSFNMARKLYNFRHGKTPEIFNQTSARDKYNTLLHVLNLRS